MKANNAFILFIFLTKFLSTSITAQASANETNTPVVTTSIAGQNLHIRVYGLSRSTIRFPTCGYTIATLSSNNSSPLRLKILWSLMQTQTANKNTETRIPSESSLEIAELRSQNEFAEIVITDLQGITTTTNLELSIDSTFSKRFNTWEGNIFLEAPFREK